MMTRWDLKRIFSRVSQNDFTNAIGTIQNVYTDPFIAPTLEVNFYSALPHSTTSSDDLVDAFLAQARKEKIFKTVSALKDITPELWNKAVLVEARIQSGDKYAHIDAKGYLPRRMTFYASSNNDACEQAKLAVTKKFSGWWKGDGFSSYHHDVTYG
jgi:hypothetical protein